MNEPEEVTPWIIWKATKVKWSFEGILLFSVVNALFSVLIQKCLSYSYSSPVALALHLLTLATYSAWTSCWKQLNPFGKFQQMQKIIHSRRRIQHVWPPESLGFKRLGLPFRNMLHTEGGFNRKAPEECKVWFKEQQQQSKETSRFAWSSKIKRTHLGYRWWINETFPRDRTPAGLLKLNQGRFVSLILISGWLQTVWLNRKMLMVTMADIALNIIESWCYLGNWVMHL